MAREVVPFRSRKLTNVASGVGSTDYVSFHWTWGDVPIRKLIVTLPQAMQTDGPLARENCQNSKGEPVFHFRLTLRHSSSNKSGPSQLNHDANGYVQDVSSSKIVAMPPIRRNTTAEQRST